MKNSKFILLLIAVGFLAVSCSDFLDVNTDPNNPSEVTPNLVLPVGLYYTADYIQGTPSGRSLNHLGNMFMYNYGEANGFSWYGTEFKYAVMPEFYDQLWDYAYQNALKQYEVLADLSDEKYGYYKAIGLIMEAYHFQILVDLYGDIPYSQALERGATPTPEYDDAAAVYDSLLVDLSNAVSIIESTNELAAAVDVGEGDIMFEGDMHKWMQFANTVKIRILTRLSGVKPAAFINGELAKIQSNGAGYITYNVKINPGYLEQTNKLNPMWAYFGTDSEGNIVNTQNATSATQFLIEFYQQTNDTLRLASIWDKSELDGVEYKGINQGFPNTSDATLPENVSNLKLGGGILKSMTMGSTIFTLAEHELNLAELALKGLNVNGSAQSHYEAGVQASFDYLGAGSAADYLAQSIENVSWSASSNKLDAIMTQKWLATLGITAAQSWFDYNRTGYPSGAPLNPSANIPTASTGFPISADAGSHDDRPVRLMYPQSEKTTNSKNVPDQTQATAFSEKIFWAN